MKAFLIRVSIRLGFYTFCLFVVLLCNATLFDETEVTSLFQFLGVALLFEGAMGWLPPKLRGVLKFPDHARPEDVLAKVARIIGVCTLALFCSVFLATTIGIRREVDGLRQAFLSSDIQTSWPEGAEIRTLKTKRRDGWSTSDWMRAHVDELHGIKPEESR